MALTLSHGGPTIYRSPARSRHVLVGTIEGVVSIEVLADEFLGMDPVEYAARAMKATAPFWT